MVDYLPRSSWGARPAKGGPGALTVSRVQGIALHWPGTTSSKPIGRDNVAGALRGWQAFHLDDRGWSDIAYQVAVDQWGRAWTLRGLRTQSGANGNADVNERYGSLLLVLVKGEEPSEAMKATVREVIADFRAIYPNGDAIRPHSAVRPDGTDCPGDAARAAITRGDFTPQSEPTPKEELTMAEAREILDELKADRELAGKRWAQTQDALTAHDRQEDGRYAELHQVHEKVDALNAQLAVIAKILDAMTKPQGENR